MINQKVSVSVIVPVYNGAEFLEKCLVAIFASEHPALEVIVVNDGSTDNSADIARSMGAQVLLTGRPQSGPAAARNLASEKARGDVLLFVDADVVVKPDTISKVVTVFQSRPDISALFGSYDDNPGEKNFLSQYRNLLHHFVHQNSSSEAATFWAGLGAIRSEVFAAVEGFDCERFQIPSIEDIELGGRLRSNGYSILLDKTIQAQHLKKWAAVSMLRTDIFCRALPWSKLLLTRREMINDLNLKTSDRLSAVLVGICIAILPLVFFIPAIVVLIPLLLLAILFLNWRIFSFFLANRGLLFAVKAFPWQLLYFFYSGATFVLCWFRYALPRYLGFQKGEDISGIRIVR